MTLSPATRVRNWRDRKRKAGLVHLDKWVPADKLQDILDAIDEITTPINISDETMRGIMDSASKAADAQRRAIDEITGETDK